MSDADFLNDYNQSLTALNQQMMQVGLDEIYPNIYIIGLPRSGTTLLTQVLFNALDVTCTNNFISKFWEAPLVGFKIAKLILRDHKTNVFSSVYGKNEDPYSPHEFSYFWHRLLNMSDKALEKMKYEEMKANINWEEVRKVILNINQITERPVVYKPLELIGNCLTEFKEALPKSLFIYIERNQEEVALSLAKGRLDYYNDINTWFSSYPPHHEELTMLSYDEQIAGQVTGLMKMYNEELPKVTVENLLHITYDDLCNEPWKVIDQTVDKLKTLSGKEVKVLHPIKTPFKKSIPTLENEEIAHNVKNALAKRV